ncbi:NitT/TauT family transport system substrate-binding protein [Actinocorallia herbida]|uniref:NitT/TauT family transport system substrate-binding protein n=1 Tax=Actinocorallia herbida TaxID=58109 RepID=A0A3N1CVM3_9ACTN|nr:ABC transporter substrate-binding protein [Actinocorallia herbida]ROO85349.1 NitT/TauT family transport system substrate-binding protein [Actinocorallia herbida]
MKNRSLLTLLIAPVLAACTVAGNAADDDGRIEVVVGYQSKTINTVTAGTLLRSLGYFEKNLGDEYRVVWQDYESGAPITAEMLAGKIDIGSMGDYPLLINGSRAQAQGGDARTELVSITGYNLRGALNGVVVAEDSDAGTLADLKGGTVSASVGSAGHGTLVQALGRIGLDPAEDVKIENQQPSVGASSLQSGGAAALAQFVAWPGQLVQAGQARLLYDGGALDVPTFHGVVVRKGFADVEGDVLQAFLKAQIEATTYLHEHPLDAAESVAKETGLAPETVYLYNGANGIATFDVTVKPELRAAFEQDVPFLKSIGVLEQPLDVAAFFDDSHLREAYGPSYDADTGKKANGAALPGDPLKAGEVWLDGETATHPVADPAALLRFVREAGEKGQKVRAAYVPDARTGTRWYADHSVWLRDGDALLPFATRENAAAYREDHAGTQEVSYEAAVKAA